MIKVQSVTEGIDPAPLTFGSPPANSVIVDNYSASFLYVVDAAVYVPPKSTRQIGLPAPDTTPQVSWRAPAGFTNPAPSGGVALLTWTNATAVTTAATSVTGTMDVNVTAPVTAEITGPVTITPEAGATFEILGQVSFPSAQEVVFPSAQQVSFPSAQEVVFPSAQAVDANVTGGVVDINVNAGQTIITETGSVTDIAVANGWFAFSWYISTTRSILIAANANRRGLVILSLYGNVGSYVTLDANSAYAPFAQLYPGDYWEMPAPIFTGDVYATGQAGATGYITGYEIQ